MTSRIAGESVSSITSRSMPMPSPPAGGMPTSNAFRKSSSTPQASSSPRAFFSAYEKKEITHNLYVVRLSVALCVYVCVCDVYVYVC